MSQFELDARNLFCPMPVIRTQDRIQTLQMGDILTVTCTDHGALSDIPTWCRINGHRVVEQRDLGVTVEVVVEVGGVTK